MVSLVLMVILSQSISLVTQNVYLSSQWSLWSRLKCGLRDPSCGLIHGIIPFSFYSKELYFRLGTSSIVILGSSWWFSLRSLWSSL